MIRWCLVILFAFIFSIYILNIFSENFGKYLDYILVVSIGVVVFVGFPFIVNLVYLLRLYFGKSPRSLRLTPYFRDKLPDANYARAVNAGKSLFENLHRLDKRLVSANMCPFSTFVSYDDVVDRRSVKWSSSSDACRVVEELLNSFSADDVVKECYEDLSYLHSRLTVAAAMNVPFCLIVRENGNTSELEWEKRKGGV